MYYFLFLVPTNILSVLEEFGSSGYRVLALAYKDLPKKVNWKSLYHLKLENVNHCLSLLYFSYKICVIIIHFKIFLKVQSNLIFLGFLVMQNKLKPQSSNVIQQLRTANIKCVMVTGKHEFIVR